ncbi:MAG: S-adenosylmethionine:tRNA ribosyltransferase-isomerase [Actinomycetota bacterium]
MTTFAVPNELAAGEPPEARGLPRDHVRLLVATTSGIDHARFDEIDRFLDPGDLLVVNTSGTLPAAVNGRIGDQELDIHFSTALDDGSWAIELRMQDRSGPFLDARPGQIVEVPDARIELVEGYPDAVKFGRLWRARIETKGSVLGYLARHGHPISYHYTKEQQPLSAYQTVFADVPGSAEMPSAARPFSEALVTRLVTRGVSFAPIVLHCAVSSLETGEAPLPERFEVPASTARAVNRALASGSRVVAVGTTVTRALESASEPSGLVRPARGWTELVVGRDHPPRVVQGLITGWHDPGASHLLLLEAVAGAETVQRAYDEALAHRYLWHEFGDSCLLLP